MSELHEDFARWLQSVARADAADDPNALIVDPKTEPCTCSVCRSGGSECKGECTRMGARRGDQNGPRAVLVACTPAEARADAVATAITRATRDAVLSGAWRADARRDGTPRPQLGGSVGGIDTTARSVRVVASTPKSVEGQAPITAWDLDRFTKNPVVLWAHDSASLPIGTASDVTFTPGVGLEMTITLASERVTPLAEAVWNGLLEGCVRGVSVGFEPPVSPGVPAELYEVSLCPVPADEDALVEASKRAKGDDPDQDDDDEDDEVTYDRSDGIAGARAERDRRMANAWRERPAEDQTPAAGNVGAARADGVDALRAARDEAMSNAWKTPPRSDGT